MTRQQDRAAARSLQKMLDAAGKKEARLAARRARAARRASKRAKKEMA